MLTSCNAAAFRSKEHPYQNNEGSSFHILTRLNNHSNGMLLKAYRPNAHQSLLTLDPLEHCSGGNERLTSLVLQCLFSSAEIWGIMNKPLKLSPQTIHLQFLNILFTHFREEDILGCSNSVDYQGRSTDADIGGGGGERRSQLGGQGQQPQVRSPPGGFYGMPPINIYKSIMKKIAVLFHLTASGQLHTR